MIINVSLLTHMPPAMKATEECDILVFVTHTDMDTWGAIETSSLTVKIGVLNPAREASHPVLSGAG